MHLTDVSRETCIHSHEQRWCKTSKFGSHWPLWPAACTQPTATSAGGCGPCAHWVAIAAHRAGIPRGAPRVCTAPRGQARACPPAQAAAAAGSDMRQRDCPTPRAGCRPPGGFGAGAAPTARLGLRLRHAGLAANAGPAMSPQPSRGYRAGGAIRRDITSARPAQAGVGRNHGRAMKGAAGQWFAVMVVRARWSYRRDCEGPQIPMLATPPHPGAAAR